ncbi:hypothetical protein DH2020_028224 [Rehmannia glutinosa]|uniref:Protein kinase domain-containing protein n=1 Tax=Rehmannia glutinosa TaxID=99300 RepID=A0ABR0VRY7_REHGL
MSYANNITTDQSSLLALKTHITSDPHNILTNNWTKTSVCSWIGVTCGSRHHRVTALDISNIELQGTIPPEIGNLSFLVSLNISGNYFNGDLPEELSRLRRLKAVDFSSNSFGGKIPKSWFGSLLELQVLLLQRNALHGNIPTEIGKLAKLKILRLGFNGLIGDVPVSIFNMPSLQILSLTYNNLSGNLPVDICGHGRLGLRGLFLSYNMFYGEIPSSLEKCSQLEAISFSYNGFSGHVPREIGNMTMLETLYLGGNSLSGGIPQEIGNLYNLKNLGLEQNELTGFIPLAIFNVTSLQQIALANNNLSGSLPPHIGNLTSLTTILLNDNRFTGAIPQELGYIWELNYLDLANNMFTHGIPLCIFNMSKIRTISLSQNLLSGNLPTTSFNLPNLEKLYLNINNLTGLVLNSITNCTKLTAIDLSFNQLTGPIPNSLGNLRLLQILNLGVNYFTSSAELSFLTSLTNCLYLEELSLTENPLNGLLPRSIGNFSNYFRYMAATSCMIKGNIPTEIGNLSNLQDLYLGNNELHGLIPNTFRGLQKLQRMYLSDNRFSGSLPDSLYLSLLDLSSNSLNGTLSPNISNLKGAVAIDLSRNNLLGTIPSTIGSLQRLINISLAHNRFHESIPESMSNMLSLEILDLSQNNLSGAIPKSLQTLKYLMYLNVSYNELSGEIPSDGPFRNFTDQSFMFNKDLCGSPRFDVHPCPINSDDKKRIKKKLKVIFVSLGLVVVIFVAAVILLAMRYRKKNQSPNIFDLLSPIQQRRISYYELQQATDGYNESNLLGMGGFGAVYKGILRDGTVLAVKVLNLQVQGAMKSFDAECEVLRNLRHRNLTKVVCSCSNDDFKAIVLDYMPKGSLEKWLYSHNHFLDIIQRLNIMIDVACALEYLHHGNNRPVIHCDLKPSNVLLDDDMVAHVSDFGMAKLLGEEDSFTHTRTLATLGYMAPEYGMEGKISPRSDVYSYGIMLMEVFMRTKPNDERFVGDFSMRNWVKNSVPNNVLRIVDANLLDPNEQQFTGKLNCLTSIMEVALSCTTESPRERTGIKDILSTLNKIKHGLIVYIGGSS